MTWTIKLLTAGYFSALTILIGALYVKDAKHNQKIFDETGERLCVPNCKRCKIERLQKMKREKDLRLAKERELEEKEDEFIR